MMKLEVVSDLLSAVAEFIEEHPEGAAFTARKLSSVLAHQAQREAEERERTNRQNVARGY